MKEWLFGASLGVAVGCALGIAINYANNDPQAFTGKLLAIDGDTFLRSHDHMRYRLARIDAPEMPDHCRPGRHCVPGDPYLAQRSLQWLLDQGTPRCRTIDVDIYHRKIVDCTIDRMGNISDLMLAMGQAQEYHRP